MKLELKNRSLIKISGLDSETFLQNQFSNDISKLDNSTIQFNAYCQHQGKIIAILWVIRSNDDFFLSLPSDLLETVISRLKMFVIMSDVLVEDASDGFYQIGLINEVDSKAYQLNEKLAFLLTSKNDTRNINALINDNEWAKNSIDSLLPEVFFKTSEKFVPQMLNLDINEFGVNFSKGCYPGQEVVARLHYLGKAKRRLFSFRSDSEMQIGDNLYCASSNAAKTRGDRYKGSGMVVNRVKFNSEFYCLATLDVELLDDKITINNENGPQLNLIKS